MVPGLRNAEPRNSVLYNGIRFFIVMGLDRKFFSSFLGAGTAVHVKVLTTGNR